MMLRQRIYATTHPRRAYMLASRLRNMGYNPTLNMKLRRAEHRRAAVVMLPEASIDREQWNELVNSVIRETEP